MKDTPDWRNTLLGLLFSSREMVVDDMRCLNVYIKQPEALYSEKEIVYDMKNRLIAWLYLNNFCNWVCEQKQILKCNNDIHIFGGGMEDDPESFCEECNGTGVYKTVNLYLYGFVMDRKQWSWHQPQEDAIIKPVITTKANEEEYKTFGRSLTDYGNVEQRMWNIWFFLVLKGMMKQDIQYRIRKSLSNHYLKVRIVIDYSFSRASKRLGIKRKKPKTNDFPF